MADSSCSAISVCAVTPGQGHHTGGPHGLMSTSTLAGPGLDLAHGLIAVTTKHRVLLLALAVQ